jgi:hypothetical protein
LGTSAKFVKVVNKPREQFKNKNGRQISSPKPFKLLKATIAPEAFIFEYLSEVQRQVRL